MAAKDHRKELFTILVKAAAVDPLRLRSQFSEEGEKLDFEAHWRSFLARAGAVYNVASAVERYFASQGPRSKLFERAALARTLWDYACELPSNEQTNWAAMLVDLDYFDEALGDLTRFAQRGGDLIIFDRVMAADLDMFHDSINWRLLGRTCFRAIYDRLAHVPAAASSTGDAAIAKENRELKATVADLTAQNEAFERRLAALEKRVGGQ